MPAHLPTKACPRLDRGWVPVRRQEHAPRKDPGLIPPRSTRPLFRSSHAFHRSRAHAACRSLSNNLEQSWRQHAINDCRWILAGKGAQVRTRPPEVVGFAHHDPRAIIVQAKPLLCWSWNLDSGRGIGGWRMGDGQHGDERTLRVVFKNDDDRGGTVFAFLLPLSMLAQPQIAVADNHARPRARPTHGFQSFSSSSR